MGDLAIVAKLADFEDDVVGGAKFLKEHFGQLSEKGKNLMFETLMGKWNELPEEARNIVASLAFQCEAGRKRMAENLEKSASKLGPGKIRQDLIGK